MNRYAVFLASLLAAALIPPAPAQNRSGPTAPRNPSAQGTPGAPRSVPASTPGLAPVTAPALPPTPAAATPAGPGPLAVSGAALLERARELEVPASALAEAVRDAGSLEQAAANLRQLALLQEGENLPADPEAALDVLSRVWHAASPSLPPPEIDRTLPVPSRVVRRDGVEYRLHGLIHGHLLPAHARKVRALADRLAADHARLYWEQRLPAFYGSSYGVEILDHAAKDGAPARIRELTRDAAADRAAGGFLYGMPLLVAGLFGYGAANALSHAPADPQAWALAALAGAVSYTLWRPLTPVGLLRLLEAGDALLAGATDRALRRLRYTASSHLRNRLEPLDTYRSEPPMPLSALDDPEHWRRSKALAEVLRAEAASKETSRVHLITGMNHLSEIAWALEHPGADASGAERPNLP